MREGPGALAFPSSTGYRGIEVYSDEEVMEGYEAGSAGGYQVSSAAENLENWLAKWDVRDPALLQDLRARYRTVAWLDHLSVEESWQGRGLGSGLLQQWLKETDAEAVLLIADAFEKQREGFSLKAFYEGHGFQVLEETPQGPLMRWER